MRRLLLHLTNKMYKVSFSAHNTMHKEAPFVAYNTVKAKVSLQLKRLCVGTCLLQLTTQFVERFLLHL